MDVSCPALSPSSLTPRANHTASASPNSLWVLGRGLITGGLLLGEFLGGEEEEAWGLNEDVCSSPGEAPAPVSNPGRLGRGMVAAVGDGVVAAPQSVLECGSCRPLSLGWR